MKLSNEQKVRYFSKYALSLGTRLKKNIPWSEVSIAAKGYVTEIENYAATLPDSDAYQDPNNSVDSIAMARSFKEAGRKRYLDATKNQPEQPLEMVEPSSNTCEFEVGGTCDQGLIVDVWDTDGEGLAIMLRAPDDCWRDFMANNITNYKPPVRVVMWKSGALATSNENVVDTWRFPGEDSGIEKGYWTPAP